jgi:hypothetical protein
MTGPLGRVGPIVVSVIVLIVGAALGYLWASTSFQIANTGLWQLEPTYQGIYIQSVADAYANDGDDGLALERLQFLCQTNTGAGGLNDAFSQARTRYADRAAQMRNLDQLQTLVANGTIVQSQIVPVCSYAPANALVPSFVPILLLVLIAAGIVGAGVFQMIRANEAEGGAAIGADAPAAGAATGERTRPTMPSMPSFGRKKPESGQETARSAAAMGAQISKTVEKTDFSDDPPIVQFMTTYLHGDDLYDDSFSVETPSGEFLGETGVGISETLPGSDPAKSVTAFEVWLFDKNDIRTVTKVLMSAHAFSDDALRARLAPKGEAVQVDSGKKILLETASLRIQARIVDLSYVGGPVPPNGVFDRITIELAAWKKDGSGGGGAPAGAGAPGRVNLPGAPSGGGTPPTGSPPISG